MSKSGKNIIIAVAVIVLLLVGIIIINSIDTSKGGSENQESSEPIYTIISENASDIANIEVTSDSGVIKAVNLGDSVWTVNDMSTDDIDSSKAYSLAGSVSPLTSKNKIEESPSDLSKYGLDFPQITVKITKKDGNAEIIYIGDSSPTLGEYFVMKDGDNTVYTMYSYKVAALRQPLSYYQEFNRFNVNIDDISSIKMIRSDETIELKLIDVIDDNTNNVWEMISPYHSAANDDYIDNKILGPIENIVLDNIKEDADGGFSSTSSILILTITPYDNSTGEYGESYTETLMFGKTDGDSTYVKYKNKVFLVTTEDIEFINEKSFNIVSKLQALLDISKVSSVTLEYGDTQHIMDIEHKDTEFEFKIDGSDTDNSVSQKMYQNIIALNVDSLYRGETLGDTVMKITYKGIKSDDDTVVEFKSVDELNCALVRDGKTEFEIKKSKLTEFMETFDEYAKNPYK